MFPMAIPVVEFQAWDTKLGGVSCKKTKFAILPALHSPSLEILPIWSFLPKKQRVSGESPATPPLMDHMVPNLKARIPLNKEIIKVV